MNKIKNYCSILAETAYQQIVIDGGITFSHNAEQVKKALLYMLTDAVGIYDVQLWDKTQDYDFKWDLYDRCQQLCEQHGLDPILFYGVKKVGAKPETIMESLEYLNVSELKSILREHGLKVSGNRDELEERIKEHLQFSQLQEIIEQRYHEKISHQQIKAIRQKYEALYGFLSARYYFLRDIVKYHILSQNHQIMQTHNIVANLEFLDANNDDEKTLAEFLYAHGFNGVIVHQQVCKMLPLFPNDRSHIQFKMQRKQTSQTLKQNNTPPSTQSQSTIPIQKHGQNNKAYSQKDNRKHLLIYIMCALFVLFLLSLIFN